jgi:glyoxylase-like metal-dependent hydrolase (beta-lactamase superfamily II)
VILETLDAGFFVANCYIVGCEETGKGMVIDPSAKAKTILSAAQDLGLSISFIVATHTHPDHIPSLAQVWEATDAEYLVHEEERTGGITQSVGRLVSLVHSGSLKAPPKPHRLLKDGDLIELGSLTFTVLHTPGHTAGGISLVGHGVVFTGDTLFQSGVGRTDFSGMSHEWLMESICEKLMVLPDETRVYPGHGPSSTIGQERRSNGFVREWLGRDQG